MLSHLSEDLSLSVLAGRVSLSPRHFRRRFVATFGATPARFVERLRLVEACRRLLSSPACTIASIAKTVGFKSDEAFRLTFGRRFGIHPSSYQKRFHPTQP